jgi:hypothetical protein
VPRSSVLTRQSEDARAAASAAHAAASILASLSEKVVTREQILPNIESSDFEYLMQLLPVRRVSLSVDKRRQLLHISAQKSC